MRTFLNKRDECNAVRLCTLCIYECVCVCDNVRLCYFRSVSIELTIFRLELKILWDSLPNGCAYYTYAWCDGMFEKNSNDKQQQNRTETVNRTKQWKKRYKMFHTEEHINKIYKIYCMYVCVFRWIYRYKYEYKINTQKHKMMTS